MHEREILERIGHIMAAIDDLTAAVAANATAVNNLVTAYQAGGSGTPSDSMAVEAQVALLEASTTTATNAVTPAPVGQPVTTSAVPLLTGTVTDYKGAPVSASPFVTPSHPATPAYPATPTHPAVPPVPVPVDRSTMTTAEAAAAASRGS